MQPMLATATGVLPSGPDWVFEFKWDGVRTLLDVTEHGARLSSRAGNDVSAGYPELVAQAVGVGDALLDGEIVAFVDGRPSFEHLQTRMHLRGKSEVARAAADTPVTYVVFDILRRFGVDLTARPWTERRATLERFAADHDGWTLSPWFDDGAATETVARDQGLEGVVAKLGTAPYRPGARTETWRKLRFTRAGDFVIIGWESASEHPATLSSLVLGVSTAHGLHYAGRVGSGLAGRIAARLKAMLVEQRQPAIDGVPPPATRSRTLHWTQPSVVVEVEFTARTDDGRLRQPVFRGIRADKRVDEARGDE